MVETGRFRRVIGAVLTTLLLAAAGGSAATPANGAQLDDLLPHLHTGLIAEPAPLPVGSEGRIPVSLRLADSIWTNDGSHPPPASRLRIDFDEAFHLHLAGVPACPSGPHFDIRIDESPCEEFEFATGKMKLEVAFPELEPVTVSARAIAFRIDRRKLMIHAFLTAPVTGLVAIPLDLTRAPAGSAYGLTATAETPKIAGGYGSLVYLGLRFRKGLFSAACPEGRLQSRVINTFADGGRVSAASISTCRARRSASS